MSSRNTMTYAYALESAPIPDLRQLLERLYQGRTLQHFRSGQTIRLLPDEIWVVCRGVVQLGTLYDNGDEALLGLVCPSMPFGLPLTVVYPYQASALTDVDLMRLRLSEVVQSPMLAQGIFRHLVRRLQQSEAILTVTGYRRVEDRLRNLLLLLGQEVGQPGTGGTRLNVRLTHQQIASTIGTTRVTVTRLLSQLQEAGWLKMDGSRHIVLIEQTALAQTA
jgi:CRP-like cAMP-binding protein